MGKSLNDIKRDIALLTLNIECLDPGSKHSAIGHLEETIGILKIGAEHDLATLANQNLTEEKQETKLKVDLLDNDDAWMFNDDSFIDDIDYESNNEMVPVQEKEHHENESFNDHRNNEDQIPNNEIKQEPVQQEPVVISLNPDTYHGKIDSGNDMLKCDPCNVYLPRAYTMKRHEEDPKHLANVNTDSTVTVKQIAQMSEPEESSKHIIKGSFSGSKLVEKDTDRTPKLNENYSQTEVGMNLYQCPECPTQYNKKNSLMKHRFIHTGKFMCQKCKAPFTSRRGLKFHIRNPSNCLTLKKRRAPRNSTAANKHSKKEANTKKENKNILTQEVGLAKSYLSERNESTPPKQIIEMTVDKSPESEESLIHMPSSKEGNTTATTHVCKICLKQFNRKLYLQKHKNVHSERYKCPGCKEPFSSRQGLGRHNRNPNNCVNLQKTRSSQKVIANKSTKIDTDTRRETK